MQLNILVNPENRAMITDFGSARAIHSGTAGAALRSVEATQATEIQERTSGEVPNLEPLKAEIGESGKFITMTGPAWTIRWAAPELLRGDPPGLESDIWAFGWICWEVRRLGVRLHRPQLKSLLAAGRHRELSV